MCTKSGSQLRLRNRLLKNFLEFTPEVKKTKNKNFLLFRLEEFFPLREILQIFLLLFVKLFLEPTDLIFTDFFLISLYATQISAISMRSREHHNHD